MLRPVKSAAAVWVLVLAACGGGGSGGAPDAAATPDAGPVADPSRDILSTGLEVDVSTRHGTATIALAGSDSGGATFEVGDLTIDDVRGPDGEPLPWRTADGLIDVGVPVTTDAVSLAIDYDYQIHDNFDGAMSTGLTLLWPYYCGNLFPCKSDPADGLTFSLSLTGVDSASTAVYPATIDADSPSYMIAWAIGDYTYQQLGTTTAGTKVGVWYLPGGDTAATSGTAHLRDVFDWYETNLGPYSFGDEVASVAAPWGAGALGGMEHHPFWHVATGAMASQEVHAHEAAHGWYGDGVRIACWEDFVLSEGTVSYLAARSLEAVAGTTVSDAIWLSYSRRLSRVTMLPAWPDSCNQIDILGDNLFTDAPYMKGAYFYLALERKIGRPALDAALSSFYMSHVGKAARMQDLLDHIASETGYDPTACAVSWLRTMPPPATDSTCQ